MFLDGPAPWHHGAEDAESQGPQGADVPKESDDANAAQGAREADAAEQPGQTGPLEPMKQWGETPQEWAFNQYLKIYIYIIIYI